METKVVNIDIANIDTAKIKEAARAIEAGLLVGFPTETVYGIGCRVEAESLAKLNSIKNRSPDKYYTLHISRPDGAKRYVPHIGLRAKKLIEACWPGPLTIVFELDEQSLAGAQNNLAEEVFRSLYKDNSIGIRCPNHPVASKLLEETLYPVVAPSANLEGRQPGVDAGEVLAQLEGQIELLVDGGRCQYKENSTVVKIGKMGMEILRAGVYSKTTLEEKSKVKFLFVCTGNTCRSPMAEGMFRKYLAEKLDCSIDLLEEKGYKVHSAGTMRMAGVPASAESVAACTAKGVDITGHESQPLSTQLIEESDFIFVMTKAHRQYVLALSDEAGGKCQLLAGEKEVADPIGQSQKVYNDCVQMIEDAVKKRVSGLAI
ncbi:MAG: L-threonylcarbamoyladenylate synthase [Planctomycetota bacterium]|jgi:protein-tyrosine phosphatase